MRRVLFYDLLNGPEKKMFKWTSKKMTGDFYEDSIKI